MQCRWTMRQMLCPNLFGSNYDNGSCRNKLLNTKKLVFNKAYNLIMAFKLR
jgi:hypothetical protein